MKKSIIALLLTTVVLVTLPGCESTSSSSSKSNAKPAATPNPVLQQARARSVMR